MQFTQPSVDRLLTAPAFDHHFLLESRRPVLPRSRLLLPIWRPCRGRRLWFARPQVDLERPREEGPVAVGALGERLLVEVLEGVGVVLLQLVALDLSSDHPVEGIRRLRGHRII